MGASKLPVSVSVLALCAVLVSCGGGGGDGGEGGAQAGPLGAARFSLTGKVGADRLYGGAIVTAYDSRGSVCKAGAADADGSYVITLSPTDRACAFPLVVSADIPDGNDELPLPEGVKGEGRQWFAFIPEITSEGQSLTADITPITTAITALALGRLPSVGLPNAKTSLTAARADDAAYKIAEALSSFMSATGVSFADLSRAPTAGSALATMMQMVRVTTTRVDSTRQSQVRFQSATEHRPIVLVLTDGNPVTAAYVDSGLGMAVEAVDQNELRSGLALLPELTQALATFVASPSTMRDPTCFLHNGLRDAEALFDMPPGWTLGAGPAENPRVLRINTFTNLVNETLEERNPGAATLAFIGFDFRDMRGMKRRAYTWLIKGAQDVGGCSSVGADWRVLGNQRPVYLNTATYALHDISYNQEFAMRIDAKGTGTEHFVGTSGPGGEYSHVLISGPGIPGEGRVFINKGSYLLSKLTLLQLRNFGNIIFNPTSTAAQIGNAGTAVDDSVLDTRAIIIPDPNIRAEITDSFFDEQNSYTYRFFTRYDSLAPALTLVDILPKRPYLSSELPFDYFSSVGINLDNLVRGLQTPEPITVNWSLPPDLRGKAMMPLVAFFERISCYTASTWPRCTRRSTYHAEYTISPEYFADDITQQAVTITPWDPVDGELVRMAKVRVRVLDSLNRQMETAVSMDYAR